MGMFASIAETKVDDLEPSRDLPAGIYVLQVAGEHEVRMTDNEMWEIITIPCVIIAPDEDGVDEDLLAEFGKVAGVKMRRQFFFSQDEADENSRAKTNEDMVKFCETCGVETSGKTVLQMLADTVDTQFVAGIIQKPNKKDASQSFPEISRTFAVE